MHDTIWPPGSNLEFHCVCSAKRLDGDVMLSFLPCLSNHRVMDLPEGITGDPNFVYHKICDQMAYRLADSDTLINHTVEGLDSNLDSYYRQNFTNSFFIGPFSIIGSPQETPAIDTYGCLSWLNRYQPATVAYVSLGTLALLQPCELTSLAMGLEESRVPFLWSLKEEMQSLLPSGFLDRMNEAGKGKIVPWAPQTSVLKHSAVGAFVSHCGWHSVLESIVGGVPLVCRPYFGDQQVNARLVSYVWKSGIALEEGFFTEEGIVKALSVMFKKDEGKKMRGKALELQDLAIAALDENGSTMKNLKMLLKFVSEC
jgi:UDP:flavonoid glycosyltransferase YjiC (YdhE family)